VADNGGAAPGPAGLLTCAAQIPYTVEQDEDGAWCTHADFVTDVVRGGANGVGDTEEAAIADLHSVLAVMVEEYGLPYS
jgi:predicted RNase H-like HicB family nuclease